MGEKQLESERQVAATFQSLENFLPLTTVGNAANNEESGGVLQMAKV